MRFIITMLVILTVPTWCFSATIYVPGNHSTIQGAIDAAGDGDTIIVKPGTYVENINFLGKAITVTSEQGPEVTVIDGNEAGSVVSFKSGEGSDSVLEGFTIKNGTGTGPSGNGYGGGIHCKGSSPTIRKNIIKGNSTYEGGGIFTSQLSTPMITMNHIVNNSALYGGGIACNSSSPEIRDNIISGNTASTEGGGLLCSLNCHPVVDNNYFTGNKATRYGGGLEFWNGCDPVITSNVIMDNEVEQYAGGGICVSYFCYGTIANNVIAYNTAKGESYGGGGVFIDRNTETEIINNMIYGNVATDGRGGGIDVNDASIGFIINNTIFGNSAYYCGGLSCRQSSYSYVANTILWDNSGDQGSEIRVGSTPLPSTVDISYSDVKGGLGSTHTKPNCTLYWGSGMIDADPLFVDPAIGDLHVRCTSPCCETGDNSAPSLPSEDFEGDPRIAAGTVDMGADEFHRHLYFTGNATPGGTVALKFVGSAGEAQVALIVGFGVFDPPLPGAYGDWYVAPPMFLLTGLGPIPSVGVYVLPGTLPASIPGPYTVYLQAMIGYQLTNLCVMDVN